MDIIDGLTMLNADEIDYNELSDEVLKELALGEELFIATSALSYLGIRGSVYALPVSWKILTESIGDKYLQSIALRNVFEEDHKRALGYMEAQVAKCDPVILEALMDIMVENPNEFRKRSGATSVKKVLERLCRISENERFPSSDIREFFMETFASASVLSREDGDSRTAEPV